MKIALIHIRLMNKGGLETRLINYMNYFLANGHEVTIITSKISGEVNIPANVHVLQIPLSKYPKVVRHLLFSYKLEKLLKTHSFGYALSLERTWSQDHLIAPNTHIGFLKAQNQWWRTPSDLIQLYLDRRSFKTVPHIYACSKMVRDEIIENYHIEPSKIQVVFPPLNTIKFNAAKRIHRNEYQEKYRINNQYINFLFVSTSHKRKGLDLLIRIFSRIENQNKHLYIAGSNANYSQSNIHSLGFVSETPELYIAVDATLHPAIYEPFGQIISESIACGTYVIVSDHVGAKEIIQNEQMGMTISSSDEDTWAKCIASFDKRTSLSNQLIDPVTKELSLENHMKKIFPNNN